MPHQSALTCFIHTECLFNFKAKFLLDSFHNWQLWVIFVKTRDYEYEN